MGTVSTQRLTELPPLPPGFCMRKQVRADSNAKVYGATAHPVTEDPQREGIRWPQATSLSSGQTNPASFHLSEQHISLCAFFLNVCHKTAPGRELKSYYRYVSEDLGNYTFL